MTRVRVDPDACMGTGFCARIAEAVFRLDEDADVAVVLRDEVPAELEDEVREAEAACPAGAIEVTE